MAAATQNITLKRADTTKLRITVTKAGVVVNLTGSSLYFMAKRDYSDADNTAILNLTTANGGIVITDAVNGIAVITVLPAGLVALENVQTYLTYSVRLKDTSAEVHSLVEGLATVTPVPQLAVL